MTWNEVKNDTCHNPFVVLDEHQVPIEHIQDCKFKMKTILHLIVTQIMKIDIMK